MLDIKVLNSALLQLEEERKIPREKILEAIEQALAAAYKKEYGKKGQIVRCNFDPETGETNFEQIKIVVNHEDVRIVEDDEEDVVDTDDERPKYNEEHHIFVDDAMRIKADAKPEDEIIFPLEEKSDFGRIAAQTAKQVIIQKIREAEKETVLQEFGEREGEIVSGFVQKIERGNIYVDVGKASGIILYDEQIKSERYKRGDRIRAYLYKVEEGIRGVSLLLSRTHPKFLEELFASESPEVASGVVEIKSIAREAGARSKIAVYSNDPNIDPIGACVGQKGLRVATVMSELGTEKIDIIPWTEDIEQFISNSLSPARVLTIDIDKEEKTSFVEVEDDQLSLAIGKGGQNVRLAAKLTGWKIDIKGIDGTDQAVSDGEETIVDNEEIKETKIDGIPEESTVPGNEEVVED